MRYNLILSLVIVMMLSITLSSAVLINNPNLPGINHLEILQNLNLKSGTFSLQCDSTLSINFLAQSFILSKKYQNFTFTEGVLTSSTNCI